MSILDKGVCLLHISEKYCKLFKTLTSVGNIMVESIILDKTYDMTKPFNSYL